MKVSELIEKLQELDPDATVRFEKNQEWQPYVNWVTEGYVYDGSYIVPEENITDVEDYDDWDKTYLRSDLDKSVVIS